MKNGIAKRKEFQAFKSNSFSCIDNIQVNIIINQANMVVKIIDQWEYGTWFCSQLHNEIFLIYSSFAFLI